MAENRFAAGVKAAKERTSEIQTEKVTEQKVETAPVEKKEKKPSKKESIENASDVVSKRLNISDITDATQRAKKKGGRSRTFYMQDAMYDKLASVAEKQGIKPSQLLHAILDNVLDKM